MNDRLELDKRRMPPSDRAELIADRERLKKRFGKMYDDLLAVLQRYDPIGIGHLPDEYEPETDTILLRLNEAHSEHELRKIVHEEFIWWFSNSQARSYQERLENNDAGPEEKFQEIAQEIWSLLKSKGSPHD